MISLTHPLEAADVVPRSQASFAYERIRDDILSGRLAPGLKLKVQELATRLQVSPGAVREALSRLVPEQLVVSRDQRGFIVAPLSISDLDELTELRCEVERIALHLSLGRADEKWDDTLRAAARALEIQRPHAEAEPSRLQQGWVAAHRTFHRILVSAAGSRRLLVLHGQLYAQSERYRSLSVGFHIARDAAAEHREIAELALRRDVEAVIVCATSHIRETTRLIVEAAMKARAR